MLVLCLRAKACAVFSLRGVEQVGKKDGGLGEGIFTCLLEMSSGFIEDGVNGYVCLAISVRG